MDEDEKVRMSKSSFSKEWGRLSIKIKRKGSVPVRGGLSFGDVRCGSSLCRCIHPLCKSIQCHLLRVTGKEKGLALRVEEGGKR